MSTQPASALELYNGTSRLHLRSLKDARRSRLCVRVPSGSGVRRSSDDETNCRPPPVLRYAPSPHQLPDPSLLTIRHVLQTSNHTVMNVLMDQVRAVAVCRSPGLTRSDLPDRSVQRTKMGGCICPNKFSA